MLKVFKTIVEINKQQQQISDRINKNSTNFNKEWDKYRNFDIINEILPVIQRNNLVPEFNQKIDPNARGKSKNITLGSMIKDMLNLIPYGLEFGVSTVDNEDAVCIIQEEFLSLSANDLFRAYGNNIPNTWTIIGILDIATTENSNYADNFRNSLDITMNAVSTMLLSDNTKVIRPIAIYRNLRL